MTNTKFRKRALLSSVAMLLVALVALGSATFAWFSNSKDVYAKGLTLKTSAATGIEVMSETVKTANNNADFWSKTTFLNAASTTASSTTPIDLQPASWIQNAAGSSETAYVPTFATTNSDDPAKSLSGNEAVGPATAGLVAGGGKDVYAEKVYIRATSGTASVKVNSVTLTPNTTEGALPTDITNAITVLVVDNKGKVLYHNGYDDTPTEYLTAVTGTRTAATSASAYTKQTGTTFTDAITTAGTQYATVCVYLNGQHAKAFTNNVNLNNLFTEVNVNFQIAD